MAEAENEIYDFPNSVIFIKNHNTFSSPTPFHPSLNDIFCMYFFGSTVCPSGLRKKEISFSYLVQRGNFPFSNLQCVLSALIFTRIQDKSFLSSWKAVSDLSTYTVSTEICYVLDLLNL